MNKLVQDLRSVARDSEVLLRAGVSKLRGEVLAKRESVERRVRDRPLQTVALVLGVGILIGLLAACALERPDQA